MCVLALAWRSHPAFRLVLAGNRDEAHARPSEPLHRWPEAQHVLAGRDLESGGAWLGVSEQGRLAVVTNLAGYGQSTSGRPSRGALVRDSLVSDGDYASLSCPDLDVFNPFNLISAEADQAVFWCNRPKVLRRPLPPGLYGLSNGDLDQPWPKTRQLMDALDLWLNTPDADPKILLDTLASDAPPPGAEAEPEGPRRSPLFIRNPRYGTRCSTVIVVHQEGHGLMIERRFDADGQAIGETALDFSWAN